MICTTVTLVVRGKDNVTNGSISVEVTPLFISYVLNYYFMKPNGKKISAFSSCPNCQKDYRDFFDRDKISDLVKRATDM